MRVVMAERPLNDLSSSADGKISQAPGAAKLLLTPEEAASALAIGRTKLYQLMASGVLRSVRIDKCRRVPISALEDLVERLAPAGARLRNARRGCWDRSPSVGGPRS